eukprot:g15840.t1
MAILADETLGTLGTLSYSEFSQQAMDLCKSSPDFWQWRECKTPEGGTGLLARLEAAQRQQAGYAEGAEVTFALSSVTEEEKQGSAVDQDVKEELCEDPDESASVAPLTQQMCLLRHYIVYHALYKVPALFFEARHVDGSPLQHGTVVERFRLMNAQSGHAPSRDRAWAFVTQLEHPGLQRPCLALHPCRTALLMATSSPPATSSSFPPPSSATEPRAGGAGGTGGAEYLLRWLSALGPLVGLRVPLRWYQTLALAAHKSEQEKPSSPANVG